MKRTQPLIVCLAVLVAFVAGVVTTTAQQRAAEPRPVAAEGGIELYFSPDGGAADAIIREIGQARQHITVAAYYFASAPIARALLDAQRRGVRVTMILDEGQRTAQYSSTTFFLNQDIPTYLAQGFSSYHHKVMLIDGRTIITGSMNFTRAGDERNAENLLILRNKPRLMEAFQRQFAKDLEGAVRVTREDVEAARGDGGV